MKGHMMIRPDDDYPEQVQCKPYENFFQGFWNPSLTVIQNAKSHSEIRFDVVWLLYNIFA